MFQFGRQGLPYHSGGSFDEPHEPRHPYLSGPERQSPRCVFIVHPLKKGGIAPTTIGRTG